MKIYIQQTTSERYIGHEGGWVSSLGQARDFESSVLALHFCFAHRLSTVHIRARFATATSDIVWQVADVPELLQHTYEN